MVKARVVLAIPILVAHAVSASPYDLALIRGFANPEDVELAPAVGALLVSEMGFGAPTSGGGLATVAWSEEGGLSGRPHRLWPSADALAPRQQVGDPRCTGPPDASAFSGHGLSTARTRGGRQIVAVIGHGAREAIEHFEVVGVGPELRARWVGCVPLPPGAAGNDLVLDSDGSILVTNYIPTVHGLRAWIWLKAASFGWNTGNVLRWRPAEGWSAVPHSEGSMPNGILRHGGQTYVAYNGAREIVALQGDGVPKRSLAVSGSPDNLSAGPNDTILAALLDPSSPGAWSIAAIDPSLGRSQIVYAHDGRRLRSVTSVAFDGVRYFLGSMDGDAVGVLSPHAAPQATGIEERPGE
jgi:hypothetical protein